MTDLSGLDRLDQVRAIISGLFDGDHVVGVGVTDPRDLRAEPMGSEAAHLANALPKRKAEFAAGRVAARAAMAQIGVPAAPILAHADRAPIWPLGLTGSISHKDTLCAAVVSSAQITLGLDIEEEGPLNPDLISSICTSQEQVAIAGPDAPHLAKLIFSAKEAAYKAQYPQTQQLFGFDHMAVTLDFDRQRFVAKMVKPVAHLDVGTILIGRFATVAGHLVTGVTLEHFAHEGA